MVTKAGRERSAVRPRGVLETACATCPRSRSSRWCSSSPTAHLEAALPVYSVQTLHANADGYGLLWTGFGAGAFAGVLTLTKLSRRWRPSIALPMIAVLWGALLCPLFFIRRESFLDRNAQRTKGIFDGRRG
jgi:Transmembrane secretion effector